MTCLGKESKDAFQGGSAWLVLVSMEHKELKLARVIQILICC